MPEHRTATRDPSLAARLVARVPLTYADAADRALDRPAHVRAGSGLAWVPAGVAVVQDDANFIAVVEPSTGHVRAIPLPAGEGGLRQFDDGRGNKRHKLDLEACVAAEHGGETLLLAFGSGSTAAREHVVIVGGWTDGEPTVTLAHAPDLYAALRRETAFAGSELNVEGAVVVGDRLRLFGRGNGAPRDGVLPVDATCDLALAPLVAHLRAPHDSPAPAPGHVVQYSLGTLDGVRLTFTDATVWRDRVVYSAAAEDSPDATLDGPVAGSAIGVMDARGDARWAPITLASGEPFAGKVEGLVPADAAADRLMRRLLGETPGGPGADRLLVVVDVDDPMTPSELCVVELDGPWLDRAAPAPPATRRRHPPPPSARPPRTPRPSPPP